MGDLNERKPKAVNTDENQVGGVQRKDLCVSFCCCFFVCFSFDEFDHLWDICLNYMLGVQMLPTNCKNAVDLDNRDVPTSNIM